MNTVREKIELISHLKQDMALRVLLVVLGIITFLGLYFMGMFTHVYDVFLLISITAIMYIILQVLIIMKKTTILVKYIFGFIDIIIITVLIMHTGDIQSPLYMIYILILVYEGLTLGRKEYILFIIVLMLIGFTISALLPNYNEQGLSVESIEFAIAGMKFVFLIVFGLLTLLFERKLLEQRVSLNNVLSENIKLSVKLKKFNQELIDRVITATNSLENEAELNMELYKKTQELFMNTTKALISAIDAKDPYTYGHTERMAIISLRIFDEYSKKAELNNKAKLRENLELAALLHDIGKIGIHDKVLLKPGKLNDKEWQEIRKHPIIGSNILESIEELSEVSEIISHHHEKYDGTGYISGLKGEEIPLLSRVIAIADAYDAMTSSRPYRKKMNESIAIKEIENNSGTQFDPELVKAFLRTFK